MNDAELHKAINDSGFPLQIALKQLTHGHRDWHAELPEVPWRDPVSGAEKFIDLVASRIGEDPSRLVIECKRSKETEWLFLRDPMKHPEGGDRWDVRTRVIVRSSRSGGVNDGWQDVPFRPGSQKPTTA